MRRGGGLTLNAFSSRSTMKKLHRAHLIKTFNSQTDVPSLALPPCRPVIGKRCPEGGSWTEAGDRHKQRDESADHTHHGCNRRPSQKPGWGGGGHRRVMGKGYRHFPPLEIGSVVNHSLPFALAFGSPGKRCSSRGGPRKRS